MKACSSIRSRRSAAGRLGLGVAVLLLAAGVACAPGEVSGENAFPIGTPDPASVQNSNGALAFYHNVVATMPTLLDPFVVETGSLTDELVNMPLPLFSTSPYAGLDSRTNVTASSEGHYKRLHRFRAQAREARGFAMSYLPDSVATPLRGHLYALEGYAEIFLADLFCSGIPLSTADYGADYTLTAGFQTNEVYTHAVELFDSALTLLGGSDSVRLRYLAAVGQGRALLGRGDYAGAKAAVEVVPDDYQYAVSFIETSTQRSLLNEIAARMQSNSVPADGVPEVAEQEGFNGLSYRSSADPRVPVTILGQNSGENLYFPAKYTPGDQVTFELASGVEARLIEAEAALQAGSGEWLTVLNTLRQTVGLADTTDPGTAEARVDLLFRERAFWLYLTGHRQGDLRRLIRQYHRTSETVYPVGPYSGANGVYGSIVVLPVPASERELNPKYTGCIPSEG